MFKFALLLVVAVVSVQGFLPHKGHAKFEELSVPKIFAALTQHAKGTIDHSMNNLKNLLDQASKQVRLIPKDNVENVKQRIQRFVSAYDAGQVCFDKLKPDLREIVDVSRNGYGACSQEAIDGLWPIEQDNIYGMQKIVEFYQGVLQQIIQCVQDNEATPLNLNKCLKDLVKPVEEQFKALVEILNIIDERTEEALAKLQETIFICTGTVGVKISLMEEKYIRDFNDCMAATQ